MWIAGFKYLIESTKLLQDLMKKRSEQEENML